VISEAGAYSISIDCLDRLGGSQQEAELLVMTISPESIRD
jgi:hypothetical protein